MSAELGSLRPLSLACTWPPSCCVLSWSFPYVFVPGVPLCCDQTSSYYKDASQTGSGPIRQPHVTVTTSLKPVPLRRPLPVSWGHNSAHDSPLPISAENLDNDGARCLGRRAQIAGGRWDHGGGASRPDCSLHSPWEPSRVVCGRGASLHVPTTSPGDSQELRQEASTEFGVTKTRV